MAWVVLNRNLQVLEIGFGKSIPAITVSKDSHEQTSMFFTLDTHIPPLATYITGKDEEKPMPQSKVLPDISQDPLEQGFEDRQYDLAVATNALHATEKFMKVRQM